MSGSILCSPLSSLLPHPGRSPVVSPRSEGRAARPHAGSRGLSGRVSDGSTGHAPGTSPRGAVVLAMVVDARGERVGEREDRSVSAGCSGSLLFVWAPATCRRRGPPATPSPRESERRRDARLAKPKRARRISLDVLWSVIEPRPTGVAAEFQDYRVTRQSTLPATLLPTGNNSRSSSNRCSRTSSRNTRSSKRSRRRSAILVGIRILAVEIRVIGVEIIVVGPGDAIVADPTPIRAVAR